MLPRGIWACATLNVMTHEIYCVSHWGEKRYHKKAVWQRCCRFFGWTFWCDLPQNPYLLGNDPTAPSNCSEISLVLFVWFFGFVSPFWLLITSSSKASKSESSSSTLPTHKGKEGGHICEYIFWKKSPEKVSSPRHDDMPHMYSCNKIINSSNFFFWMHWFWCRGAACCYEDRPHSLSGPPSPRSSHRQRQLSISPVPRVSC